MSTVYGAAATRDRQGWFFGLTGGQWSLVVLFAAPAWMAMAMQRWLLLVPLIPAWIVVSLLVCVPIRGWSAFQWLGVLGRFLLGQITGWSRFQSRAAAGEIDLGDPDDPEEEREADEADLPGVLTGIQIHDGPPLPGQPSRPAVIQNHPARTWAATARITHPGIGMADLDERDRMGAGLAELFEAASANNQIDLVALQVRTVPDDGTERADWVRGNIRDRVPRLSMMVASQLAALTEGTAVRNEAFVTVVVREETLARDAKHAGRGVTGRARVLYGILAEVEARLTGQVGCTSVNWLDTSELASAIRSGFEPGDAAALADAAIHAHELARDAAGVPVAAAGPTNASTAMRYYRHGNWVSTSSTIMLPRKGALMGALARALVPSQPGERRALTVFYKPVPNAVASRKTGRAEVSAEMGATLNRKLGRTERARDRKARQQVHEVDEKLEHGRSLVKVYGAISITVPGHWNPQDYGRRLDASVRLCGFAPLPVDGAHDAGFVAAAIPLGVGLPKQRK